MALIADIIKKYEAQAAMINSKPVEKKPRDDIFLKVEPRGDPVGEDPSIGLGMGSIWKAQPIKLNPPAKIITEEEAKQRRMSLEEEVERLRKENEQLKRELAQLKARLNF